jgi:hypothetical protein
MGFGRSGIPCEDRAAMNFDRLVHNRTPLVMACAPLCDRHGHDVLAIIGKLTFVLSPSGRADVADEPVPIFARDDYAPARTPDRRWPCLRRASDLVDEKPGTDVTLCGTAYPSGRETSMLVALRVAASPRELSKVIRVHGQRVWLRDIGGVRPGPAAPLEPTPLTYDLAYGGEDREGDEPLVEWRNPAGCGVARDKKTLVDRPAPQLEDPRAPLDGDAPAPAGFGPVPGYWAPRAGWAGTFDDVWRRERAPLPPADFDPRHHLAGPADLWSESPLRGDEAIEVVGASAEGPLRLALPRVMPRFEVLLRGEVTAVACRLDTLALDTDARTASLVFRGRVRLPRKSEQLEAVYASLGDGTDAALRDRWRPALPVLPGDVSAASRTDRAGSSSS